MKAVGGYFELERHPGAEYYSNALRLNSGRNALEYVLLAHRYIKLYVPCFTCDAVLEPLRRQAIPFEFYRVDENLEPVFEFGKVGRGEAFLYTNYFGLKDRYLADLPLDRKKLIVDNAQAFFSKPVPDTVTFYSPRKFFGVPDGAYLANSEKADIDLPESRSAARVAHLLRRMEQGPEAGYPAFRQNERRLGEQPLMRMSPLTQSLLEGIDYGWAAARRRRNFQYLAAQLGRENLIRLDLSERSVPMVYPFLTRDAGARNRLSENRIYAGQYWKEVMMRVDRQSVEYRYADQLVHLPVDQRYGEEDMERIIRLLAK